MWAEQEESFGHSLGRADLLRQFMDLLEEGIRQAKAESEAGTLTPQLAKALQHWVQKAQGLKESRRKKDKQARYLVAATEFMELSTNRATSLSQEETDHRLQCAWKWWDFMISLAAARHSGTGYLRQSSLC